MEVMDGMGVMRFMNCSRNIFKQHHEFTIRILHKPKEFEERRVFLDQPEGELHMSENQNKHLHPLHVGDIEIEGVAPVRQYIEYHNEMEGVVPAQQQHEYQNDNMGGRENKHVLFQIVAFCHIVTCDTVVSTILCLSTFQNSKSILIVWTTLNFILFLSRICFVIFTKKYFLISLAIHFELQSALFIWILYSMDAYIQKSFYIPMFVFIIFYWFTSLVLIIFSFHLSKNNDH